MKKHKQNMNLRTAVDLAIDIIESAKEQLQLTESGEKNLFKIKAYLLNPDRMYVWCHEWKNSNGENVLTPIGNAKSYADAMKSQNCSHLKHFQLMELIDVNPQVKSKQKTNTKKR